MTNLEVSLAIVRAIRDLQIPGICRGICPLFGHEAGNRAMPRTPYFIGLRGIFGKVGVTDGSRTRDLQSHNLALCQLSYGHHATRPPQYSRAPRPLSNRLSPKNG